MKRRFYLKPVEKATIPVETPCVPSLPCESSYGSTIGYLRQPGGPCAHDICQYTGMSVEDLCKLIYEEGERYLSWMAADEPEAEKILRQDKRFWNWWKLVWYGHDHYFLGFPHENAQILYPHRKNYYLATHWMKLANAHLDSPLTTLLIESTKKLRENEPVK